MRICHISTVHPLLDDRIFYKECTTLAESGFEVFYVVTHDKRETINGVNIIPLSKNENRFHRIFFKGWEALKKALDINADIYHFHDPELLFIGSILKLKGKKVVYDVHEDVPLQILNKEWLGNIFVRKMISKIFNFIEKNLAKKYDGIVTVTTDIVDKFYMNKNVILLRNFPVLAIIEKAEEAKMEKVKPILIYAGGLTKIRGIKELIQTVGLLNGKAELWLLGKWESGEFEKECREIEGWKYSKYLGLIPMENVYSYMKIADIGMCTLHPTQNHLTSWPVKAFEYMACEIPIVMSNFTYWMSEFKESAVFADPKSANDIERVVNELLQNKDLRDKIVKSNKALVKEKFSWEAESKMLTQLYEKVHNKN